MAHENPLRAARELLGLARGQWANGMMPHMIYSNRLPASMESLLWGRDAVSPSRAHTSGITQPPMLAIAVEKVAHALSHGERIKFVNAMLPCVTHYHEWIYAQRDPHDTGLAICLHAWESGLDDSPYWTEVMAQAPDLPRAHWLREYRFVNPSQRASPSDIRHMLSLVHLLRQYRYDSRKVIEHTPVAVYDVVFNSVFASANEALERLADLVDVELSDGLYRRFAPTRRALEKLWDAESGQYFSRDARSGDFLRSPTVATFMPLFAGTAAPSRAEQLRQLLVNEGGFNVAFPLPSVPTTSPAFEQQRYWRGPTWINMNWFVIQGLLRYGFTEEADWLRAHTIGLVGMSGFREYYNPLTGDGLGATNFSWTAALTLDLLSTSAAQSSIDD